MSATLMDMSRHAAFRWLAALSCVVVGSSCTVLFDYGDDPSDGGHGAVGGGGAEGGGSGGAASAGGAGGSAASCDDAGDCDDDNDCTDDTCVSGACGNEPVNDGSSCASGSGLGICENSICVVACTEADPTVCDDDNVCTVDSCDTAIGQCANVAIDDGPIAGAQTEGDCQGVVCLGGVSSVEIDATDVLVDGNACTDDLCEGSTPTNPPVAQGTSCGASLVCDASGNCQGCNTAADCPGTDTFCQSRTCSGGQCGVSNTANGTPLPGPDQNAGPCQEVQCNGTGSTKTVSRPAGTSCSDGAYCNGAETCLSGNCSQQSPPPCPGPNGDGDGDCSETCNESTDSCTANDTNGAPCNDGLFCNGGDSCSNGSCLAANDDPCPGPDGDGDCSESCNESTDSCTGNDPNDSPCNDGLFCSVNEECNGNGFCGGGTDPCNDGVGGDCSNSCNEAANNCTAQDMEGSSCNYNQSSGCCGPNGNCYPQCV